MGGFTMPEEFEGGNQTAETIESNEAPIQQESAEQPSSPQESNYFTVKYNKEERQVSYDEAPDYIQKGMNYDKVNQRVGEYESQLSRMQNLMGYQSQEELMQALDEYEQQQESQRYEDAGIDKDQFNQLVENHPDMQYAREMRQKEQETQKFNNEANELFAEFPDLKADQIPATVWQLKESKGLSLLDSYLRVSYKSLGQQKEQEAIQKLQQNAISSPGALGLGAEHNTSYSTMSATDKKALRERVLSGENVQL
jgi:hypothetical protein